MPKVSVVIPTHNRPRQLANAMRSVVRQTETDFEVLVIDDGSADDAAADVVHVCRDPRIHYMRLPISRGPAAARNAGIRGSSAPYVAFLDDDDEWLPEKLKVQLATFEQGDPRVGVVHTARITVDRTAGTEVIDRPGPFDPSSGLNVITTSTVLMRRACFDTVGLFDEALGLAEDFDLWIRVGQRFVVRYVDEPLAIYFIHHGYQITADDAVAVESWERFLLKHRCVFEARRRRHCLVQLSLAARYRSLGDRSRMWRALRRAMRLWPLEPRVYRTIVQSLCVNKRKQEEPTSGCEVLKR